MASKAAENLTAQIVEAVLRTLGPTVEPVQLHRPLIPPTAWEYVKECLATGWVSSVGSFVTRFEQDLAEFTGCGRVVATVSGSAALEVCFHLAGVKAGDEVLAPALTFVATANAISHCNATPHWIDACPSRLSMCPQALEDRLKQISQPGPAGTLNRETGRRLAAVCLMHCFGHPGDIDAILSICQRYELPLIEDAAESLGSFYKGKHTGRFGKLSAVSFNGNKIITTGGGGAILTDDQDLANLAKHLTTTAKTPHPWEFYHDAVAWNFRLPNLNAALGVAQLEILPSLLRAKRELAQSYERVFLELSDELEFLCEPADSHSNYWLNCVILKPKRAQQRKAILQALNDHGFQSRPVWRPMHELPMYAGSPRGALPVTESLCARAINIPSSADLRPEA